MSPLKPQATYDDFARLDIRIGKVVEVQPFPRARNPSYKVGVDVGAQLPDLVRHCSTSRGSVMRPRSAEAATV